MARGTGRRAPGSGTADGDAALWERIAKTVKPIKRVRARAQAPTDPASQAGETAAPPPRAPKPAAPRRAEPPRPAARPPLAPGTAPGLDKRTALRLRRGQLPVDGRIDLHGMTQAEAEAALMRFVAASVAAGRRCVLVITGKGLAREHGGVLRARLGEWINGPALRGHVLAYAPAQPKDGGAGAFYVLLRRKRGP